MVVALLLLLLLVLVHYERAVCTRVTGARLTDFLRTVHRHTIGRGDRDKIVVVGSAPYAPDWVKHHYEHFRGLGYRFVALNNAYRAFPDPVSQIDEWWHSNNFFGFNQEHHPEQDHSMAPALRDREYIVHATAAECSTTMVDLLYMLKDLNGPVEVLVVASDFNYTPGNDTHFYKAKGTQDPMKCGRDHLLTQLELVQQNMEASGSRVYNAGFQKQSLLPFPKYFSPPPYIQPT
jgi:hypothetical protein